jgi:hypothetical protein
VDSTQSSTRPHPNVNAKQATVSVLLAHAATAVMVPSFNPDIACPVQMARCTTKLAEAVHVMVTLYKMEEGFVSIFVGSSRVTTFLLLPVSVKRD